MKDKFTNFYLFGFWIFAFIIIILIMFSSFVSNAASDQDYFPMSQNKNGHFTEEWKQLFETQLDSDNYNILVMYRYYQQALGRYHFYFVRYPKDADGAIYGEINNDLIQWSLYKYNHPSTNAGSAYIQNNNLYLTYGGNAYEIFLNLESSNYNTDIDYISNFQLYSSNNVDTRRIVLLYTVGDNIPDGDTATEDMEKPKIDDYIPDWSNTPNFDSSSVENALQSVFNGLVWLGDNFKDTITGIGEFISDTVRWGMQKIIDTIRFKIDEFKTIIINSINGVIAIIDNINGQVKYITEPIDTNDITNAFNQNALISVQDDFIDFLNEFDDIIRNTQEPDTFDITINIQNVRTFYNFGCRSPVVLHLGNNLNGTTKNIFRAFLWVLVIVGSIFLTEKNLSLWIKGGGFSVK